MKIEAQFRTRARLLEQLGEQLIRNESIALLELIKNSYDADASSCHVTMLEPWDTDNGKIIIEDDGEGMNDTILKNAWLEIGTDYKPKLNKNSLSNLTPKFHRNRLGEKGIGRFGVHKLGRVIEIITRRSGEEEFVLKINWDNVSESHYIESLPVSIIRRPPKHYIDTSGTRIEITRLRNVWNKRSVRECARVITSLNSPFDEKSKFRTTYKIIDSDWLSGMPSFKEILSNSLFSFSIKMNGNMITAFNYNFKPWDSMDKVQERVVDITDTNIQKTLKMTFKLDKKNIPIDLSEHRIGEVKFSGVIFDLDTQILSLMDIEKTSMKQYLEHNGGIRVYRDSMRVLEYGEPNTDWLGLGIRRINLPSKRISNNIILGAVYIKANSSSDLIEKANREGFIENDAFVSLRNSILYALGRVESQRMIDKEALRKMYSQKQKSEPVMASTNDLEVMIEKNIKDTVVKKQIYQYLDRIKSEYEHIKDTLMKSAGAGLSLFTVLHQVDKIIKELLIMNRQEVAPKQIEEKIKILSHLVESYGILVKKTDIKKQDMNRIFEHCLDSVKYRIGFHEISLINRVSNQSAVSTAKCSENHVLNAFVNVVDNALWWLEYSNPQKKKLLVDIIEDPPGYVSIIVADNGCGFSLPVEMMTKPFISDKPEGTGIGLHLTDMLMSAQGGRLLFPEYGDLDIPKDFARGAIVQMAFKKD